MKAENIFRTLGCIALASLVSFAVFADVRADDPANYDASEPAVLGVQSAEGEV